MNDDKELIDKGTYYEIKDYEPIVNRDENGNVVSVIHCPYIPKFLVDGPAQFRQGEIMETATRQAMTVNQAKSITANSELFALAA